MPYFRPLLRAALLPALAVLFAIPSSATSFVRVSDEALVDESPVIAVVRVLSADDSVGTSGRVEPSTEYTVEVAQILKGELSDPTVRVRVLGGRAAHGMNLKIFGAPTFAVGERAIVFLVPNKDGSYHLKHFLQGAFHEAALADPADPADRSLAVRNLGGGTEMKVAPSGPTVAAGAPDGPRDFAAFATWIRKRAAGERPAATYLRDPLDSTVQGILQKYTLFTGGDGKALRWFVFDSSGSVSWRTHQTGQSGLADGGVSEASAGMAAWTNDSGTPISYQNVGTTTASAGFAGGADGVNTILWNDPNGEVDPYSCGSGGTLAIGGPWFSNATQMFSGTAYHAISEGDVVVNNGLDCFFAGANGVSAASEMLAHELGHTLGLDHSLDNQALMRAFVHNDGRGAQLGSDDIAAIACVYAGSCGGSPTPPATPTGLSASTLSSSSIQLSWNDVATTETGYRVEMKPNGGSYSEVKTLAANSTSTTITGLSPSTLYFFRVRASGSGGLFSGYSNEASATTQSGGTTIPNPPTNLQAAPLSTSSIQLNWFDASSDETGFRIEMKTSGGVYADVGGVAANSTSSLVSGLAASTTYFFRVRASGTGGFSGYSNEASATTLSGGGTPPTAPSNLQAATLSSTAVQLNWLDNSNNETGFRIEVKPSGGSYADVAGVAAGSTSFMVTGLTPSTTYSFRVRASGTAGFSGYSNEAMATTLAGGGTCTPDSHTFCLDGGRFRVAVIFRTTATGSTSPGNVVPGSTADSGLFWFFAPTNWEVMVKVLNGCGVNNRHWVFLAAATNVEYTVTVTDTVTHAQKSYHNNLGSIAPVTTDINAFASCQAPATADGASAGAATAPLVDDAPAPAAVEELGAADEESAWSAPVKASCAPDSHTFCLDGGRFRATINFRSASTGPTSSGNVVPGGTADSGLFWFFAPTNWELMVKVLNGCSVNSRHWVFFAGATNVEFTLSITDTVTLAQKVYHNNLGAVSPVTTDTNAFQACP
jgi:hypothetical protein